MNLIYLEKRDPQKNVHRFYAMYITPTIFGDWSLIRRWGRIGSQGAVLENWFGTEQEAINEEQKILKSKEKHGYQPSPNQ